MKRTEKGPGRSMDSFQVLFSSYMSKAGSMVENSLS